MSKYVPDISTHRWVIVSPLRVSRPEGKKKAAACIFAPGNEHLTTEEMFRIGKGSPGEPGWQIRAIKNKYPITDIHEVIIHSPHCERDIENLSSAHVKRIFEVYRHRYNEHRKRGQVLIFCNHGEHAGASVRHPHAQLVVLPNQINLDALVREPVQNVVADNTFFTIYCPDFSQWPYEVWVVPKNENSFFGDITNEEIADLAGIVKQMIKRLKHAYESGPLFKKVDKSKRPFGYNYYIYPKENWYMRIIPRFVHRAGFELGTGLSVNIIDPMDAAEELKKE